MNYAHEKIPVKNFERPKEGLYEVAISKISGKVAGENTPKSLTINYIKKYSNVLYSFSITLSLRFYIKSTNFMNIL